MSKKPTDDLKLDSPKEKRHDKLNQSEVEEDVRAIMQSIERKRKDSGNLLDDIQGSFYEKESKKESSVGTGLDHVNEIPRNIHQRE